MKITKKIFRQLIVGKMIDHIDTTKIFAGEHAEEVSRANKIATEIIEFAEEYKLFKDDVL